MRCSLKDVRSRVRSVISEAPETSEDKYMVWEDQLFARLDTLPARQVSGERVLFHMTPEQCRIAKSFARDDVHYTRRIKHNGTWCHLEEKIVEGVWDVKFDAPRFLDLPVTELWVPVESFSPDERPDEALPEDYYAL